MTSSSSAGPSSRSSTAPVPQLPLPPPSSFVTSVTSITSLDNGYQGDGEWSRPASRGADQSPTGSAPHAKTAPPPAPIPVDPMTDSDFFTESDADPHEEVPAAVRRGGDRRAQVIDGTLYGSSMPTNQHQRCPSFTASINEEMVSSGVYSDLERRTEEATSSDGGKNFPEEEVVTLAGDFSPDGSTKTLSSKSEQSQVKEAELSNNIINNNNNNNENDMQEPDSTVNEEENNLKNQQQNLSASPVDGPTLVTNSPSEIIELNLSKQSLPDQKIRSAMKTSGKTNHNLTTSSLKTPTNKDENHHQLKKYKMPKRNVVSKIKTMIESSSSTLNRTAGGGGGGNASTEDENQENWRPTRPPKPARKMGKWDAVMNKIAQGQAEQKLKPSRLKEVKSKVYTNIGSGGSQTNQQIDMPRRSSSTVSNATINKTKSRRTRTRTSSSSLQQQQKQQQQQQQTGTAGSPNSTPRSSMSDVSTSAPQNQPLSTPRSSKKQRDAGRSASPLSDGSTNSATSHVMTRPVNNHLPHQSGRYYVRERIREQGKAGAAPSGPKRQQARSLQVQNLSTSKVRLSKQLQRKPPGSSSRSSGLQ
ncbi:putative uncharacterized protein DDB_G0282129 [Anabrus simplex]|uniref:putative uncharacterized protein DDB_G0282129 n=1 Tax=Anabrus simplex TaxID=316456 RepID=UPI0035A2EF30